MGELSSDSAREVAGDSFFTRWSRIIKGERLCEDCPPVGYPTEKTRCLPCPRRILQESTHD